AFCPAPSCCASTLRATHPDEGASFVAVGQNGGPARGEARLRPEEEPRGVGRAQVDAAVAAALPEIVVPVGAVQTVAFLEVHHPGDRLHGVVAVGLGGLEVAHVACYELDPDAVLPERGGVFRLSIALAGGDQGR